MGSRLALAGGAVTLNYMDRKPAVGEYIGSSTNQRAEIIACAIGLESLKTPDVLLRTDSKYVVETMTGRFQRRTNFDCWERLDAATAPHQVTYEWIKGHIGHAEQDAADRLARGIAQIGDVPQMVLTEAISCLQNLITPALATAVREGLRYLANDCDGARLRDGIGFSRFDGEYGHKIASKPTLNPRELNAGRKLLRRYARQLTDCSPTLVAIL